jgi:hypothetical protein
MLCDDCLHAAICENTTQGNCDWYLSEKELKEKWIPVSERLPKEDNDYLITYEVYGERVVSKSWFDTRWGFMSENVIAWKELPEPYKEGGAE